MIKKYNIEVIIRLPNNHCLDKICSMIPNDIDKRAHFMCDIFENIVYTIQIYNKTNQTFITTSNYKIDFLCNVDESVRDIFCNRLNKFYDEEMSLYGPQTMICETCHPLFSINTMARNKSWYYKNLHNRIIIVENIYSEDGERLYDASSFLNVITRRNYHE